MMKLIYNRAIIQDADLVVNIYNSAFRDDYEKYGECPFYGYSKKRMEQKIEKSESPFNTDNLGSSKIEYPIYIVNLKEITVGVVSYGIKEGTTNEYIIKSLAVVPEYQNQEIGTQVVKYVMYQQSDWKKISVSVPVENDRVIKFFTERCGFEKGETRFSGRIEHIELFVSREFPN